MRDFTPRDAAVTGLGVVTPLGFGARAAFDALLEGRCAIREVEGPEVPAGTRLAAFVEPPFLRAEVPEAAESQVKFLNGSGQMAATAADEAVRHARLQDAQVDPARRALWLAQGDITKCDMIDFRPAIVTATQDFSHPSDLEALNRATLSQVDPLYLLDTLMNNAFSILAAWHGARGANTSLCAYAVAGLQAVSLAARAITRREADAAIAVGAGRLTGSVARWEMRLLGLVGGDAYRPLDRRRVGSAPGEGAGAFVLEPLSAARSRGVRPVAVVAGHGGASAGHATDETDVLAEVLLSAGRDAMVEARVKPSELLGIVLPGSGTPAGDRAALLAARGLLAGARVPVVAWKGATGHCGCGSDAAEAAFAAMAVAAGVLPGTVGFESADPGFSDLWIAAEPVRRDAPAVLVLSAGADAQAAALLLARA